jgi:hypothetical protein
MDNEYHPQDDEARLWLEHLERKAAALENRITQLEQVIQRAGKANNPVARAIGIALTKEARLRGLR